MVSSAHPNEISGTNRSIVRQLQQKTSHTKKRYSQSLREPLLRNIERRKEKRDAVSDARRGSRKGVSVRTSKILSEC